MANNFKEKLKELLSNKKVVAITASALGVVIVGGVVLGAVLNGKNGAGVNSSNSSSSGQIEQVDTTGHKDPKVYTNNDYTSQMPNVWNEILTNDATNTSLAGYMNSSFFEFDYKLDENGEIVPGGFEIDYSAATKLEDVTARYEGKYGITAEDVAEGHHAFAITLRNDLTWDDGTPIKAEDFVFTMSQQLSPKYLFETASNYYSGNYIIHNSQEYVKQGQSGWFAADSPYAVYSEELDSKIVFALGNPTENEAYGGAESSVRAAVGFPASYTAEAVVDYFINSYGLEASVSEILAMQGKTFAEIKADATLKASWDKLIAWWQTEPNEELDFFVTEYTYPEMSFDEVGYFVGENEYELVMVTDSTLAPIDENGDLTYEAAYYLQSFPLVKKSLWLACEDQTKTPWVNTYCSASVENSASWGPYKLTNYQTDVTYTLSRNEKWYGYGMDEYKGQYQTDRIVCDKVSEWSTAWQMFQKGEIDGVGMDVTIAEEYRNSSRAYFTPETYTYCLNLQSRANKTEDGKTNKLLNYESFRKAISLMLDRDDYCAKNNPSSLAALGLLNNMYYYDVENGKTYRESVQAKEAILNAYGATKTEDGWKVGAVEYTDIDDALDAMTGYNITLARELMTQAYNEAKEAGDFTDDMKVVLTYGIEQQSENTDRVKNWFQSAFDAATVGTPLEDKIEIEYFYFSSATWSKQFRDGEYDLIFSGWGNAPFNPYYLLCATQIEGANRYAQGWDPKAVSVTVNVQGDDTHEGGEYTFNLAEWSDAIQGKGEAGKSLPNFSLYPIEDKLAILGEIEATVLNAYYSVPVFSKFAGSLMSYKCDYISYEYNTFVGYGGTRYMTYNYDDTEWAAFVAENGGTLNYLFGRD